MRLLPLALVLVSCGWLLTGASCSPKLLVPPARAMGGESPGVLPAGAISVGGTGSRIRESSFGDDDDFTSHLVTADLTLGMGFDLDARVTATAVFMEAPHAEGDYYEEAGLDKDLRAVALRLKWNPFRNRHLAFSGGSGYGMWAGRAYYSTEGAVMIGYENPYFVPYLNYRSAYNVPLRRDSVHWAYSPQWESYAKYTQPTRSQEWIVGFKIPLRMEGPPDPWQNRNAPYFSLEFGFVDLEDRQDSFSGSTLAAGFHFPLRQAAD